jgi:hypothetical protein
MLIQQLEKTVVLNSIIKHTKFISFRRSEDFIKDNNVDNFVSILMRNGKVWFLI